MKNPLLEMLKKMEKMAEKAMEKNYQMVLDGMRIKSIKINFDDDALMQALADHDVEPRDLAEQLPKIKRKIELEVHQYIISGVNSKMMESKKMKRIMRELFND